MPLQNNFKEFGGYGSSEPALSNTTPSLSPHNVPRQQHSDVPGAMNGAPPPYHPTPHAHYSANLPPPPPHPDPGYWYSHGYVEESSWKLTSSPLVTKKARSNMIDGEASKSSDALEPSEPTNNSPDSDVPPTSSSFRNVPIRHPPPLYAQGPYPPYYGMPPPPPPPPPPPDHAFSVPQPYQWQYPPYPIYPPTGYQVGYFPYPIPPPCVHEPHMQPPQVKQPCVANTAKKRPLSTSHNKSVHTIQVPTRQQSHQTKSRKRKMYSDFVGVTYNLTHAKYQVTVTHYRKQYYLGRYKLAADAALAYDEAAKLLKGPNWKVNFSSNEAYEKARKEEIQRIGTVDENAICQSKVKEMLASNMSKLAAGLSSRSKEKTVEPVGKGSTKLTLSDEAFGRKSRGKDGAVVRFDDTSIKKTVGKKTTPFATVHSTHDVDGMSKVTPCLESGGIGTPLSSSELDSKMQLSRSKLNEDEDTNCEVKLVVKTPLPDSAGHAKSSESNTPESVIKPKVLQYQGDEIQQNATKVSTSFRPHANDSASRIEQHQHINSTTATICAQGAPPVKKSGTFVAASALMSLHGNDDE